MCELCQGRGKEGVGELLMPVHRGRVLKVAAEEPQSLQVPWPALRAGNMEVLPRAEEPRDNV